MADTSGWTLQDFANAAGTRTAPYPTCAAPETSRECPGCGEDITPLRTKTGLPKSYCSDSCRVKAQRRWRSHPDETAALRMAQYVWGEW